ncbi:MAG: protein translocase subunit SecDF [Porphyromonadaceae bacterium CG2_30_38_12]|nr:MAG: protein translocase subunit SecDF [Porphyromonadaceae bacterium CG2_30_38_12]
MQNKGIVRIFAVALTLVCLFYLSFTVVTSTYNKKAKEYAAGDKLKEYQYLDSVANEKVWLGAYTLKECREKEINLGLDLKGGMNVTLEVSVADIIHSLSGYNTSPNFLKAIQVATERQKTNSQKQYLDLFVQAYTELDPNAKLSTIFSTFELKEKISLNSSNADVVSVLEKEIDGAISNSFNVLRTRIDRFGVVQPNIQRDNNNTGRILIELPGIKEPERVRKLLQGSANLEFWETYDFSEVYNNIADANRLLGNMGSATANRDTTILDSTLAAKPKTLAAKTLSKADSLKAALTKKAVVSTDSTKQNEAFKKENPLFARLQPNLQGGQIGRGPVVGMAHSKDTAQINAYFAMKQVQEVLPRDLKLRWTVKAIDAGGEIFQLIALKVTNRDGRAPLEGDVITDARADFSQTSAYANVSMSMDQEGSKIWARLTKDNIGKSVAISLDGYIYSFPTVNTEITGGNSQITGNFTVEEAKDLANTLNSGKMPAPARIVQEDIVGPSLGQEAINSGFISFVIAFLLVLVYMVFYYGKVPGLIADTALFVNVFFLIGILASFSAVLTLPGIAGIVLTLGMAVDANVIIYERIREELRSGKTMKKSIEEGYKNAISAIVDGQVTTLITGIVLAIFGTGPIKGFANTLIIGIITSFITSVFLTRLMLEMYSSSEKAKELPFTTNLTKNWWLNAKFNFLGGRKVAYIISGSLIVISLISFATNGLNLGVDFSGGRNYVVRFDQPVKTDEVRGLLSKAFDGVSVQVITIGSDNQVRISTKYKIDSNSETIDDEIEERLYTGLKPLLNNVTKETFVTENIQSSQKVGPTIADDIKTAAIWAITFAIIAIGLYIFIRFREVGYAMGATTALIHDALITIGMFSLGYKFMPFSMEIDQSFIAAILTVVGYSVNDTVIIFDRIREEVGLYPKRERSSVMNGAINQTLGRTFSTSMTTLVVLFAIFFFGGETIRGFIFAMTFGILIGTYSSVFVASPITYEFYKRKSKKAELKTTVDSKK